MMDPAQTLLATGTILIASVVGSPHCAGMCGPMAVAACATPCGQPIARGQWSYHLARGVAYAFVGAIAGAVGGITDAAGSLASVQHLSTILAGLTLACAGVVMLMKWRGVRVATPQLPNAWMALLRRLHLLALRVPQAHRAAALGLVTPLLPCGWLWAFVAFAAGTGHAVSGALVLAAFWLGTVPALAAVVMGARFASVRVATTRCGRWLQPTVALLLIALGVETALHRAALADRVMASVARDPVAADAQPACCGGTTEVPNAATPPACCGGPEQEATPQSKERANP